MAFYLVDVGQQNKQSTHMHLVRMLAHGNTRTLISLTMGLFILKKSLNISRPYRYIFSECSLQKSPEMHSWGIENSIFFWDKLRTQTSQDLPYCPPCQNNPAYGYAHRRSEGCGFESRLETQKCF